MSFDLLGVFTAGLLTFFTPCLLPLVPIYLSAITGGDLRFAMESGRRQLIFRALLFAAGFSLVFVLLGLGVSSIGSFLNDHRSVLKAAGGVLILLFGLKFIGFIQIPLFDRTVRATNKSPQTSIGWLNALIMGVVFAAGWSPCAGPILGSVLSYTVSATTTPLTGALYLAVYAFGVSLPLLVVAIFAQAGTRLLKRMGPHLMTLEKALGLALVFVAGWLIFDASYYQQPVEQDRQIACLQEVGQNAEKKALMIAFTSKNCIVCNRMQPVLDSINQECKARKLDIREINLSEPDNQKFRQAYKLVATPTFIFLDSKGFEVARLVGEQNETALKQALSALIGEPCTGLGLLEPLQQEKVLLEDQDLKPSCELDASGKQSGSCNDQTAKLGPKKPH